MPLNFCAISYLPAPVSDVTPGSGQRCGGLSGNIIIVWISTFARQQAAKYPCYELDTLENTLKVEVANAINTHSNLLTRKLLNHTIHITHTTLHKWHLTLGTCICLAKLSLFFTTLGPTGPIGKIYGKKWSIPMASLLPLWIQHIKISAQLYMIEAQERHEKSPKKVTSRQARCWFSVWLLIWSKPVYCSMIWHQHLSPIAPNMLRQDP